jgi:hypothetical protein
MSMLHSWSHHIFNHPTKDDQVVDYPMKDDRAVDYPTKDLFVLLLCTCKTTGSTKLFQFSFLVLWSVLVILSFYSKYIYSVAVMSMSVLLIPFKFIEFPSVFKE